MAKILVVDDETTLVETIRYNLRREGHTVATAIDGVEALAAARRDHPDLVILDLMLPRLDGYEVCRVLRRESSVPVLMLTAKDDEVDKIVGLELGADDYMTKPFGMRELMARVRAMLRRVQLTREETSIRTDEPEPSIRSKDLVVDLRQHRVFLGGNEVSLKPREFDLLAFLARNRGQVFTRDALLQKVWGYDYSGESRTVDVHVRGLREKIELNPSEPTRIETVRGVGYRFAG